MPRRSRPQPVAVVAVPLGRVVSIRYEHASNGKTYEHTFKRRRPVLARTRDGRSLIVAPVNAATFIEDAA